MTLTVPLTPEEEAKLIVLAELRGVSLGFFVRSVVIDIIEEGIVVSKEADPHAEDGEKSIEELFHTFDSVSIQPGIPEETFLEKIGMDDVPSCRYECSSPRP